MPVDFAGTTAIAADQCGIPWLFNRARNSQQRGHLRCESTALQVSAAQSSSSQSYLAMYQRQATSAGTASANPATAPAAEADTETVSLHVDAAAPSVAQETAAAPSAEVFAEIWKDGSKIGTVYTDGQAVLPALTTGHVAAGQGAGHPYLRAQEISRMVGGEVRYVDLPALQVARTRAQLRSTYGT